MLVHKRTMGVLDRIWKGFYRRGPGGVSEPVCQTATLADVDDPDEWWDIPSTDHLAAVIRSCYPWLEPQVDEAGALTGVTVLREGRSEEERLREARAREAARRGYRSPGRVRPKGLMPFLGASQHTSNPGAAPDMRGKKPRKEE